MLCKWPCGTVCWLFLCFFNFIPLTAFHFIHARDYSEEGETSSGAGMMGGSSSGISVGGGGEKRALDLSPRASAAAGGSGSGGQQLSPESKKRCVLDPMTASFSSSKHLVQLAKIQVSCGIVQVLKCSDMGSTIWVLSPFCT